MIDLAVIGGGAAGFFAAIQVKKNNPNLNVVIYEKSKTVLGKVKVSGGGRCNVTHACFDNKLLCTYYPRGSKELLSLFERFNPKDCIDWFKMNGVELKTESDGRMFPISDHSETIINCFLKLCKDLNITILTGNMVQSISKSSIFSMQINNELVLAKKVLIACGSSDYFWKILRNMGHTIIEPVPSLFTFNIKHPLINDLQGITVSNASLSILTDNKTLKKFKLNASDITQSGPLLITHWGLSGPAILKLSAIGARLFHHLNYKFKVKLNLTNRRPEILFQELLNYKVTYSKKQILNTPLFDLPHRLWQRIHSLIFENTLIKWSEASKKDIFLMAECLSDYKIEVNGKSTFKEEFVTAGGIELKEVNFKTMESKLFSGLYFAGEVLNIDALTGGFNFQAAWTEAWVIGESASI